VYSIPARPDSLTVKQYDGTSITFFIKGDEFFNYKTTLDGYLISENNKGLYEYVTKNSFGELVTSGIKASQIAMRTEAELKFVQTLQPYRRDYVNESKSMRSKRISSASEAVSKNAFPTVGSPKSLVILVNFKDLAYVTPNPKQSFSDLLNLNGYAVNGGTGSAKDYFSECSNGVFNPNFVVVGPFTLPENYSFYGENTSGSDKNPRQMVVDACKLADDAGVDFSEYDTDGDGVVDNIFIYYAGNNEAEGASSNTIWPHRWALANGSFKFDGKIVYDYACTSELRGTGNTMCGIGTFCHEFGHVLGLPDYYATNDANHHTLSYWNIMDAGAYLNQGRTPPTYSAYDRFLIDWIKPIELKESNTLTLPSLIESNQAYLISKDGNHNLNGSNPNPTEFFMIENRKRISFDSYLPNSGLLITRINYNATTWNNNGPNNSELLMGVDIMEADMLATGASLAGDVFPGTSNVSTFNPVLRDGTSINKPLTFITKLSNGDVNFRFKGGVGVPLISLTSDLQKFNTVQGTPSKEQLVALKISNLESSLSLKFKNNEHYEMKLLSENDLAWRKELSLDTANLKMDTLFISVRYNPTSASFDGVYDHSETIEISSLNAESLSLPLSGSSSRAIYVVKPTNLAATNVTYSSFTATWDGVFDASGYYLTIYSVFDGESTAKESFENGLTPAVGWVIKSESTTNSVTYSGEAVPAIWLINAGDYIQTELYDVPCTSLSFYISSLFADGSEIHVEAWDGFSWSLIDSYKILDSYKGLKKYTFSADKKYTQFRLSYKLKDGQVAIDDVSVTFSQDIEYVVKNLWVEKNSHEVNELISSVDYFFKVKASDKTYNTSTNQLLYENITDYSDAFKVKTQDDPNSDKLRVEVGIEGRVYVYLSDLNNSLYCYSISGRLMKIVKPNSLKFDLTNTILKNQLYILESGGKRVKVYLK